MRDDFNGWLLCAVMLAAAIGVCLWLASCANPVCQDNPRNMRCMTADQLTKELSK